MNDDLKLIQLKAPLIHNITNFVTMDFIASGLLAIGASPIMAYAEEELEEIIALSDSIVINIGTLDKESVIQFKKTADIASKMGKKIILDPVGAGATNYRTQTILDILLNGNITVIKGNASEIMALVNQATPKGVDSKNASFEALGAARIIANKYNLCVVVSGSKDLIVTKDSYQFVKSGHFMMTKITGMGCLFSAIIAAFVSVNSDTFQACLNASNFYKTCGFNTSLQSNGPASFKANFIDSLYNFNLNLNGELYE